MWTFGKWRCDRASPQCKDLATGTGEGALEGEDDAAAAEGGSVVVRRA